MDQSTVTTERTAMFHLATDKPVHEQNAADPGISRWLHALDRRRTAGFLILNQSRKRHHRKGTLEAGDQSFREFWRTELGTGLTTAREPTTGDRFNRNLSPAPDADEPDF
jgi:hypothetical protein